MKDSSEHSIRTLFIGGTGRSGTTIFKRILQAHSDVAGIPEYRITLDPGGLLDFYTTFKHDWTPFLYDQRLRLLKETLLKAAHSNPLAPYYRYAVKKSGLAFNRKAKLEAQYTTIGLQKYNPKYREQVDHLIEDLTDFSYQASWTGLEFGDHPVLRFAEPPYPKQVAARLGDFYNEVVAEICKNQQSHYFVDDNTWNTLYFDSILELLPEAKLVHIYRDPRDVVASYMQQIWAPSEPIKAARFYAGIMRQWWKKRDDLPKDSFYELSLEQLVEAPDETIKNICEFWQLPFEETLLSVDLSRSNTNRWRRDIPEDKFGRVTEILEPFIETLGYAKD